MKKILILDTAIYYSTIINIPSFESMAMEECLNICFSSIKKAIKNENPDIVFFTKECNREDNWRIKHYELYKCSRKTKTEKAEQFIHTVIDMLEKHPKVNLAQHTNMEGDDIIHSIVKKYPNDQVIIFTRDKDMLQNLVYDNVTVSIEEKKTYTNLYGGSCSFSEPTIYDRNKFISKFNFDVKYYTAFKAMAGDSSDGYIGVPLMGAILATIVCQLLEKHKIECNSYSDILKILEYKEYADEMWYKRLKYESDIDQNDQQAPNLYLSYMLASFKQCELDEEIVFYSS